MREKHYAMTGWVLFLFSAIFFTAADWNSMFVSEAFAIASAFCVALSSMHR
jgi:hypothetical protein